MPTPPSLTLDKALVLLELVVADGGQRPLRTLANELGLPPSTAHRLLATLRRRAFVSRSERGAYLAGPALIRLGGGSGFPGLLDRVARPVLNDLARATGLTAHLGVLEADMVTYVVKALGRAEVQTQEGMQLEAYCSGIGKVLLAHLPAADLELYLMSGPFPPLTPNTVVEPDGLKVVLERVRADGYALDDREFSSDLFCVAVPVRADRGSVCAAISLSDPSTAQGASADGRLEPLKLAARRIEERLGGSRESPPRV